MSRKCNKIFCGMPGDLVTFTSRWSIVTGAQPYIHIEVGDVAIIISKRLEEKFGRKFPPTHYLLFHSKLQVTFSISTRMKVIKLMENVSRIRHD